MSRLAYPDEQTSLKVDPDCVEGHFEADKNRRRVVAILSGALIGLVAGAVAMTKLARSAPPIPPSRIRLGSYHALSIEESLARHDAAESPACTPAQCRDSRCDPIDAPFLCLTSDSGGSRCSRLAYVPESCDISCDTSACAELLKINNYILAATCRGIKCAPEWCRVQRLCGSSAPFQCLVEAVDFRCSDDEYHWALKGCNACCDARTCGGK